jgi:hypothetical protein
MVLVAKKKIIEDVSFLENVLDHLKNGYFGIFMKIEQINLRVPLKPGVR